MRSFRTAAVAVATAAAVTLTGTTVASAEDSNPGAPNDDVTTATENVGNFGNSYNDEKGERIPDAADDRNQSDENNGANMLGDEKNWNKVSNANKTWYAVTLAGVVGTVIGGIIGAVNWLKYNGILPG
ncbi:hypothetical protein CFRA_07355 [Corynebacterium frankenforstense DSM 45800]|uniref:Or membrane protein n=1 Tax=Corynebacterium frankenforstense DSM 45800 TaxID=1437875 RepID=A0A1L7CTC4_9CORY|nr:hypothetical protein [Corynebacterium frankenforstense]APT89103.1 hypothetical protein CFRA_07355 [Corynebacterium frankenforstense DSM 45800]